MKKKILIGTLIVCALAIIATGTIAYFSVSEEATNVITSGRLTMVLHDETTGGIPFPEAGIHDIMPGQTVDKIVYIENDCPNPEYVRIYLEKSIHAEPGSDAQLTFEDITLDINNEMWTLGDDGWYYYNAVLEPGEDTEPLFTTVSFGRKLNNDYQNCGLEIIVHAQAVQSEHNGDSAILASGWPASDFDIEE